MDEPQFSVVIPLYNKRPHVARAIDSVLAQVGPSWELIVVDDASTDGSLSVVAEYEDARLRVLRRTEPGPGGYAARNEGVAAARSRWVAFLDADDAWAPGMLAELAALRAQYPEAGLVCTAWASVEPGRPGKRCSYAQRWSHVGRHRFDLLHYLRRCNRGEGAVCASAVAIEREVLQAAGGFPAGRCRRGGDRDTWLRVLMRTEGAWSPIVGATYFRDSVNMVTRQVKHGEHEICRTVTATLAARHDLSWGVRLELRRHANEAIRPYVFSEASAGRLKPEVVKLVDGWTSPYLWALAWVGRLWPWATVKGLAVVTIAREQRQAWRARRHGTARQVALHSGPC